MSLLLGSRGTTSPAPPNNPPEWTATPTINWIATVGGTYDMKDDTFDPEGNSLTFVRTAGTWPTGVTMDTAGVLTATTSVVAGDTSGITVTIDDGTNSPVSSPSISVSIIPEPPIGGGIKWNPGHYLKIQGKPTQTDQADYEQDVLQSINANMDDDAVIIGCHCGFGWGALNPTGSQYNWDLVYTVLDRVATSSKFLIAQIQSKNFSTNKGLEAPADILAQVIETNTGWTAALWRNGTEGFPDVMGRYITFWTAFIAEFDSHPNLEIFVPTESATSLGAFAPADFTTGKMAIQLDRMYKALAPLATKSNIAANINHLGTGAGDEVPALLETAYQEGMMHATPDAKATVGYTAFTGVATYSVPVTRDYRTKMGCLEVYSNDVAVQQGGEDPPETIDDEQVHKTTHLSWIPSKTGAQSWASIITAIIADPTLETTCPDKYSSCET